MSIVCPKIIIIFSATHLDACTSPFSSINDSTTTKIEIISEAPSFFLLVMICIDYYCKHHPENRAKN